MSDSVHIVYSIATKLLIGHCHIAIEIVKCVHRL